MISAGDIPLLGPCVRPDVDQDMPEIATIVRAVVCQAATQQWFIVAAFSDDDEQAPPIGPFDTYETALVTLRLMT